MRGPAFPLGGKRVTGDGRKAALDMRPVDPFTDAHGDTKLSRATDRIRTLWEATRNELYVARAARARRDRKVG